MTRAKLAAVSRCSGRRARTRFASEYDAERAARRAMENGAPPMYVYGCPLCDGWHLTRQESDGRPITPTRQRPHLDQCDRQDTHGRHDRCPGLVVVHACTPER